MARDEHGNLIKPLCVGDDTIITERHHAEHLNITHLARQVMNGQREPQEIIYADTTIQPRSLQEAADLIEAANERFDSLPAHIRSMAGNSIVRFQEMLSDPEQLGNLIDNGLPVSDDPRLHPSPQEESVEEAGSPEPTPEGGAESAGSGSDPTPAA